MRIATIERLARDLQSQPCPNYRQAALSTLRDRLEAALLRSKVLAAYAANTDCSELQIEADDEAWVRLTYVLAIGDRFTSRLVFTLRDAKLKATVSLVDATSDKCSADAVTFYSVEGLAKLAVHHAVDQRLRLLQELGFNLSVPTLKKVKKTLGHAVL